MKHRRLLTVVGSAGVVLALVGVALAADPQGAATHAAGAHEAAAHAADAHGGGESPNPARFGFVPFVSALIVFGIAFAVLAKYVWPKLLSGLEEREKKIRDEIFAAEEARARANAALKEYESSLAEARAEANKMIEATRAEQARMAADLRTKAEAEVAQLRESAMASIDAAKRAALNEIYAEATTLATAAAARILEREVNESDQQRLVEEMVAGIAKRTSERNNGSSGGAGQEEMVGGSAGHSA